MNCSSIAVTFYRVHLRRTCAVQSRDRLALVIADLFIYQLPSSSAAAKFNLQIAATVSYTHMTLMISISLLNVKNPSSLPWDRESMISWFSDFYAYIRLIDQLICMIDGRSTVIKRYANDISRDLSSRFQEIHVSISLSPPLHTVNIVNLSAFRNF